ncbi:MAG: alpha-glucan family phosphorylase [Anaerolineae bacterium]
METMNLAAGFTPIPDRLRRILEVAYNLWWSWHPEAQELFRRIDAALWEEVYHNPVKFLREVRQTALDDAASDPHYLRFFHEVMTGFDEYQVFDKTWFAQTYGDKAGKSIAYFSAEFGLHECLPIYSGGLGILSGDHIKEASDLGLPFIGIGFLYPQGYFKQAISANGDQEAIYEKVRFAEVPALPAFTPEGKEVVVSVDLPGRTIYAKVWRIQVGVVPLYLMDTDIHPNAPNDRELSARLYGGDQEMRIAQEMVLGIGGVRALRQLGLEPAVYHMNEGHSAFMVLERARELIEAGQSFDEAAEAIRKSSVFTTHTPVPAGHDAFPFHLMEKYFQGFWERMGLSRDQFMELARHDQSWGPSFSMTVLAIRLSGRQNGVSKLHGEVSRKMWHWLWPDKRVEEVPITHVTNGVHLESWLAPEMKALYDEWLPEDWVLNIDDGGMWQAVDDVPDEKLWAVHNQLRAMLVSFVRARTRQRLIRLNVDENQIAASGELFDRDALTIGFARRFATYKRATILFTDVERLKCIVHATGRPVQFVFAGKAHPRDEPGRAFIREVYHRSHEQGLAGHILFIEDYDINVARYLVSGVDVWLNTPRRPHEASGTSGQKAGANGVPNFSISDGWWVEGYNGRNGWVIGDDRAWNDHVAQDHNDANLIYDTLEKEIVPLFYERDSLDVPRGWVKMMKESIKSVAPQFSMTRMIKDYTNQLYVPAMD